MAPGRISLWRQHDSGRAASAPLVLAAVAAQRRASLLSPQAEMASFAPHFEKPRRSTHLLRRALVPRPCSADLLRCALVLSPYSTHLLRRTLPYRSTPLRPL